MSMPGRANRKKTGYAGEVAAIFFEAFQMKTGIKDRAKK